MYSSSVVVKECMSDAPKHVGLNSSKEVQLVSLGLNVSSTIFQLYSEGFKVEENRSTRRKTTNLRQGWTCLYQCTDIKPLQLIVNNPQAAYHLLPANEIQREILLDRIIYNYVLWCSFAGTETRLLQMVGKSLEMMLHARSREEVAVANCLICAALSLFARFHISGLTSGRKVSHNKNSYLLMKKCERILNVSAVNTDISRRYLNKATFYYTVGNYTKAFQTCEQMILHYKPFFAYYGYNYVDVPYSYLHYVCGRNLSIRDRIVMATVHVLLIGDSYKSFYPHELHHYVEAALPLALHIPPLSYATFMMFLCHHKLGNIRSSLYALRDLRTLVDDEHQGCRKRHIVLNLLAICLYKVGNLRGAIHACLKSMKLQPNRSGASEILDKLLRARCR